MGITCMGGEKSPSTNSRDLQAWGCNRGCLIVTSAEIKEGKGCRSAVYPCRGVEALQLRRRAAPHTRSCSSGDTATCPAPFT